MSVLGEAMLELVNQKCGTTETSGQVVLGKVYFYRIPDKCDQATQANQSFAETPKQVT
jgi:hypothetical protein